MIAILLSFIIGAYIGGHIVHSLHLHAIQQEAIATLTRTLDTLTDTPT